MVVPRVQNLLAVRTFASAGGLNKEEVEGRILSLLQGFDKVSDHPLPKTGTRKG
jgi:NADH dehydrogenase (ubiquinone) 1 alpha/beta subcomplex 1